MEAIQVLVPDQLGLSALANDPHLRGTLYDAQKAPTPEQQQATVVVVGLGDVDQEVAFFRSLPNLRLIQPLNAGFDQWTDRIPPNVGLSNARGAHGRSTAEWVAAVLLAHYRDLNRFAETQAKRIWDHRITDSPAGKRVAVLGAGETSPHTSDECWKPSPVAWCWSGEAAARACCRWKTSARCRPSKTPS